MDIIEALERKTKRQSTPFVLRQYKVVSVDAQNNTIAIQDYDTVSGIHYLDSYSPTEGDTVWAIVDEPDILVLGKLA